MKAYVSYNAATQYRKFILLFHNKKVKPPVGGWLITLRSRFVQLGFRSSKNLYVIAGQ